MTDVSAEDLQKQLEDYEGQLAIVEAALRDDPSSSEFLEVKANLVDVIKMTKDLLELKKETTKPGKKYPDINQIATRKGIYVGFKCQAKWSVDQQWYNAVVTDITEDGFKVTFTEYGNSDIVGPDDIKQIEKEIVVVESKTDKAVATGSTNKFIVDDEGKLVIPNYMKILPTDTEQTRQKKKKLIKKYKSEYRSQQLDAERNKRKSSWQEFQEKGPAAKKQRTSIFASPDTINGKVGVVGSGQGLTKTETIKYEPKKLSSKLPMGTILQGENPWAREEEPF